MDASRKRIERAAREDAKRPAPIYDKAGEVIPDGLRDVFARSDLLTDLAQDVSRACAFDVDDLAKRITSLAPAFAYLYANDVRHLG